MGYDVKQSSTAYPLVFLMIDSADHLAAKTGLSPTVTLSKNGGSFASPSGAVSEIANGWYKVAGNATDTATLGPLILHATATGADPSDDVYPVVINDPQVANTPQTGDAYARLGAPAGASVSVDIAAVKTDSAAVKAKTDNLPADPADASDIAASFATIAGYIDTEVASIKSKTDQLTFTVAGQVDSNPITRTGFSLTSAYDFAKGTTAVTESYAANTAAPTPVQALLAIHQMLSSFAITGTSYTVRKLDNVTTAYVATLDSSTTPTAISRA